MHGSQGTETALFVGFSCLHSEHRKDVMLSQHVSTSLRCLTLKWLKITLVFKLIRLKTSENDKTFLRKQHWPDRSDSFGG